MEISEEDTRAELEKTLRRFNLDDLREHASKELGTYCWRRATRILEAARRRASVRALAEALASVSGPLHAGQLDNLRLKAAGFSASARWNVHMLEPGEPHTTDASLSETGKAVGAALGVMCRVTRGPCGGVLIGLGGGRRPAVAVLYRESCCLLTSFNKPGYLKGIASGLGYKQVKNCHLSGCHIPSLLRMLESRKGARNRLAVTAPESPPARLLRPQRTRLGLDFSKTHRTASIVDSMLGKEPPTLQALTVTAETQRPGGGRPIVMTVTLASANVAGSLSDMAQHGLISENSVFFAMLDKGRSEISIKFQD